VSFAAPSATYLSLVNLGAPANSNAALPAVAATLAAPQANAAEYALAAQAALEARSAPVLEVNRILREAGVGGGNAHTAAAFASVAQVLPKGSPVASHLAAFAQAMAAGPASARRYALNRAWEDVSAPYGAEELLPKDSAPEGQEAKLTDLSRLRVP